MQSAFMRRKPHTVIFIAAHNSARRLRHHAQPHALHLDAEPLQPDLPRGRARDVSHPGSASLSPSTQALLPPTVTVEFYLPIHSCSAWARSHGRPSAAGCSRAPSAQTRRRHAESRTGRSRGTRPTSWPPSARGASPTPLATHSLRPASLLPLALVLALVAPVESSRSPLT